MSESGAAVSEGAGGSLNLERAERKATIWTVVVAAAAAAVAIGTPLVGMRVFHATDVLQVFPPWRADAPAVVRPSNNLVTDTVNAVVPGRAEFRRRVLAGDYPMWTSYPSGGAPLGAVPNAGMLSPLNAPYLVAPFWYAPALTKALQILVAAGFTFLFLRRLGLDRSVSVVGGLLFAFSGFQVVWTNWPQSNVGALIPGLFWAVERAVQMRTARAAVPIALVTAVMFLEGFPAVAVYGLLAAGAYGLVRAWAGNRSTDALHTSALLAGACAVGIGLSAVQMLPFAVYLQDLRFTHRVDLAGKHLPLNSIATLVAPDAFGSPADRIYYAPINYVEMQGFLGATALVLLGAAALRARGRRLPPGSGLFLWGGVAVVGTIVYLGGPALAIFQIIPFMATNFVGRMRSVFGFFLAALAAIGFQQIVRPGSGAGEEAPRGPRRLSFPAIVWALLVGVIVYGLVDAGLAASRREELSFFTRQMRGSLLIAGIAVAVVVLAHRARNGGRSVAAWVVPPLIAVECVAFALPFLPRIARADFYPRTAAHDFLQRAVGSDRIAPAGRTLEPGTTTYYRLRTVTAHSFQDPVWAELLGAIDPSVVRLPTFPMLPPSVNVATSPILDRLAARYFLTSPEDPVLGRVAPAGPATGTMTLRDGESGVTPIVAGSVRGVIVTLTGRLPNLDSRERLDVEILSRSGRVLTVGSRRLIPGKTGRTFWVAVPEYGRPGAVPRRLVTRVTLRAPGDAISLATTRPGCPTVSVVTGTDDGLRVEFTRGLVAYRRLHALPRFRWASRARVVPDPAERVARIAAGAPRDTVLLSGNAPPASERSGSVAVRSDTGDEIELSTRSGGAGYVVVADALRDGWHATVDGNAATLHEADHALAAVFVPAGTHRVRLSYRPRGILVGGAVSTVSLLALLGMWLVRSPRARSRDRKETPSAPA